MANNISSWPIDQKVILILSLEDFENQYPLAFTETMLYATGDI